MKGQGGERLNIGKNMYQKKSERVRRITSEIKKRKS